MPLSSVRSSLSLLFQATNWIVLKKSDKLSKMSPKRRTGQCTNEFLFYSKQYLHSVHRCVRQRDQKQTWLSLSNLFATVNFLQRCLPRASGLMHHALFVEYTDERSMNETTKQLLLAFKFSRMFNLPQNTEVVTLRQWERSSWRWRRRCYEQGQRQPVILSY